LLPARLYVQITGANRNWNVGIAATTVKGFSIYEEQFAALIEALKRSEDGPRNKPRSQPAPAFGSA
jgi:hypothetical protein